MVGIKPSCIDADQLCRTPDIYLYSLIRVTKQGKFEMPSTINLYQIGVWFCVGFFTGAGWAVAAVLVGRILSIV